jgi:AraC-like DNA-binding protein
MYHEITEKHILPADSQVMVIRVDQSDPRDWMQSAPVCSLLSQHKISHCGITKAHHPLEISRVSLSGTFFVVTLEGQGQVWIDGEWQTLLPNQACIQPPFIANAMRSVKDEAWTFCWVRYRETQRNAPMVSINSPVYGPFHAEPLQRAVEGLHVEAGNQNRLAMTQMWVDLIQAYIRSFAEPYRADDRLEEVWTLVQGDLKEPWNVDRLAKIANLSREHLRRVSLETIGRTPMQHVTFLRMRKAAQILSTTELSVAEIAEEVGYSTANAFSDVFLRVTGLRPTAFREQTKS